MNYYIWGSDCQMLMPGMDPSSDSAINLKFGGFIKETNEDYKSPENHALSNVPLLSFKNFLNKARTQESILVIYFQSKWANDYLYNSLKKLESNARFKIRVLDIFEFSINYGFSQVYDNQKIMREKILEKESEWRMLAENMTDQFSKDSMNAYVDAYLKISAKPIIDFLTPADYECFNPFSNKFSFIPSDSEVFVDVGAYDGDSILRFINATPTGSYKKIYAFEPNPNIYPALLEKTSWIPRIEPHQLALSNNESSIPFLDLNMGSRFATSNEAAGDGVIHVRACPLDSVVEYATLVKIDVEGFECEVVEGATALLKNSKPNLVIDTYHHANDAIKIYETVMKIHKYKYVGWRMSHHYLNSFYFSDTQQLN
jgi:FkbM family methyltransferase